MKAVYFMISLVITITLVILLNTSFDKIPAFGKFLSPQHGFWQNAEPVNSAAEAMIFDDLSFNAEVYFDTRMVPHIFAEKVTDAYFVQGFLHAKYRLWQMEFQTFAAAGRLTEVLGAGPDSAYLNNDRKMRRMGMVYGATRSLEEMEKDSDTKAQLDAYTAGANFYISKITASQLPLEYRLLNYVPEKWTNLKTALLLKYLSLDLAGSESDIEYTNARAFFSEEDFNRLYPLINDSTSPIIPKSTLYDSPSLNITPPASADSLYYQFKKTVDVQTISIDKDNGSNNWAVGGKKTRSGRPILCNDPHLGLNLPSLWYEVQITTPEFSVYGASLPGSPAVVIGFNDSIAWGVTNSGRDVLDFYRIQFRDEQQSEYKYNNNWQPADKKIETYRIKGGGVFYDTVSYTVFGPVLYDRHYDGRGRTPAGIDLAIRWKAHDPSNEFKTLHLLNKAANFQDYEKAIQYFYCPGQNFVFASKSGDIAMWQQGQFPAKWRRQGEFIMPGEDSAYRWQAYIPQSENPHHLNPERGFVSSANQVAADTTYPYYLGSDYDVYRGQMINRSLQKMQDVTAANMQQLQNENYNTFAESALPFLLANTDSATLNASERKYFDMVASWNFRNDNEETGPTIFTVWTDVLEQMLWMDEYSKIPGPTDLPRMATMIDLLKRDSAFSYIDNIETPEKETLKSLITAALKKACTSLMYAERDGKLPWTRFKDAGVRHLLRMEQLSRFHLNTGGGVNVINATKQFHGPSWKMVVHLTDDIEAYGIYPGGQNGNPGSKTYDEFVDDWAAGKYYRLWMMRKNEASDRRVKMAIKFTK